MRDQTPLAALPDMPSTSGDLPAMGAVNWIGLKTLYLREVRRFIKVYTQTLVAPLITTMLFLAVFALALGGDHRVVAGMPFMTFLAPGLIMMAIAQNAFANTSSSLMIGKIQGNIVDSLMAPLNAHELTFGFAIVYHAVMGALMLSLLGLAGGIWADKFDHIAAVTNFVITPLSFLSGTFYSIERLPQGAQIAAHFNPFFYMIDGFRYGFIGHADGNLWIGVAVMAVINAGLWWLCTWMFRTGYKLKA